MLYKELFLNIFLAFLGGFLMNFMPCILPLISLKISTFIKSSNKEIKIFIYKKLAYILGILSFFITLAIILLILKYTGQNFIFGSHMQSSLFLFIIFAVLIMIGFNLSGLFEIEIFSLQNTSSKFILNFSGILSEYFNGLLVSFLAIPCTAPFIASAFAFALKTNYLNIMLITFFMGIGFSSPFILSIIFGRKILRIMPKPGLWMDKFKTLMSFPIFASAAWILFVLIKQNQIYYSALCLFFLILSYFFIWFWKNFFKRNKILKIFLYIIILFFAYSIFPFDSNYIHKPQESNFINSEKIIYGEKEEFSYEKLNNYIKNKQKILVVASASWCLTCHVNEKNALSSENFFNILKSNKIIYLYIDLTNSNPDGEKFLSDNGQIGIPYYLLIDSNGQKKKLDQILKAESVINELGNLL